LTSFQNKPHPHRTPAGADYKNQTPALHRSTGHDGVHALPAHGKNLTLFEQDVLQSDHEKDTHGFPETLRVKNQKLKLSYVFDPADEADGVSVLIPLAVLNQFEDEDFDFLVPGLLQEKVQALIKSLPKQLRKNFIPVPDFARACCEVLDPSTSLYNQLSEQLQRMTGVRVKPEEWQPEKIDKHFRMRFCLQDNGQTIASSRSLADLTLSYADRANREFEHQVQYDDSVSRQGIIAWDFEHLPDQVRLSQKGSSISAFPALVDYQDSVAIELFETRADADFYHATGIARLIAFELKDEISYARKNLPHIEKSALMYIAMGSQQVLTDDIIMAGLFDSFLQAELPQDKQQFEQLIDDHKAGFIGVLNDKAELVFKILGLYRQVRLRLQQCHLSQAHLDDAWKQCEYLVYEGFIRDIPMQSLGRVPVYFQALLKRIDKTEVDSTQADKQLPIIRRLWEQYLELLQRTDVAADKLNQCRWMIEEFRISCFAQPMKTQVSVSENKILKLFADL